MRRCKQIISPPLRTIRSGRKLWVSLLLPTTPGDRSSRCVHRSTYCMERKRIPPSSSCGNQNTEFRQGPGEITTLDIARRLVLVSLSGIPTNSLSNTGTSIRKILKTPPCRFAGLCKWCSVKLIIPCDGFNVISSFHLHTSELSEF